LHNIDHNLHKWVVPTDSQKDEAGDGVELSVDEDRDDGTSRSSYNEDEPLIVL
jgi:hypothetical protein